MQHAWTVEVEETIVISHPAWRGLEHHTVSPASYIDHTIQVRRFFLVRRKGLTSDCSQLLKIMWESDLRQLLREALISRAARVDPRMPLRHRSRTSSSPSSPCACSPSSVCLQEKAEEEGPQPLELEVQIVALRRKERAT